MVSTHGLSVSLSLSLNIGVSSKVDLGIQVVKNWTSCRVMCLEEPATLSFPCREWVIIPFCRCSKILGEVGKQELLLQMLQKF